MIGWYDYIVETLLDWIWTKEPLPMGGSGIEGSQTSLKLSFKFLRMLTALKKHWSKKLLYVEYSSKQNTPQGFSAR